MNALPKKNLPVYFYGSQLHVLEALENNLKKSFPRLDIVHLAPSQFRTITVEEKQAVIEHIQNSQARIVFVGLGCPRQEVWIYEYREALSMPLIAVGAAFDFHAGTLSQAPASLQRLGLEWLYRLICEPNRLWKRYIFLNPLYLWLITLQIMKLRDFEEDNAIAPMQELRYG